MRFDEYWIGPAQLALTAALARATTGLDGEVIEVGTWQGLSAIPIARAVAPSALHVVDHWLGDGQAAVGIDPARAAERDNYAIFLANLEEARVTSVTVHKMGWREFRKGWNQPVRFLHIDATHSADEVSDNIAAFRDLMVPGGIICGDDYGFPEVSEGVRRQFEAVNTSEGKLWWKVMGIPDDPVAWAVHGHPLAFTRAYASDLATARALFPPGW